MFQPGEEIFEGAQHMIDGGILEKPKPDAALAFHIGSGQIAEQVPSAYIFIQAGFHDERGAYPRHHPRVQFNENVLHVGAACMAHCARRWLEES